MASLFEPFTAGFLSLANRCVMAPMTRQRSPDGIAGSDVAAYYARRALGEVALIITEGIWIDEPSAPGYPNVPILAGDAALAGLRGVVDAVHQAGGRIFAQLWHTGLLGATFLRESGGPPAISPSGVAADGTPIGAAMSMPDIEGAIAAYGRSAAHARSVGFDGIEIHGAHGYLPDQFFCPDTNRRTDKYGGGPSSRARFAAEVVRECRRQTAPDFPIGFRFSQWKLWDYEARPANSALDLEALLLPLAEAGVDIFHASTRRFWEPEFPGSDLNLAGWAKAITGKPVITVGSVGLEFGTPRDEAAPAPLNTLLDRLERGDFDLVALGRALLANPQWPELVRTGRISDLVPYSVESVKGFN